MKLEHFIKSFFFFYFLLIYFYSIEILIRIYLRSCKKKICIAVYDLNNSTKYRKNENKSFNYGR